MMCKSEDEGLLVELRALVDERPTYGYRRLTALLNRARRKLGCVGLSLDTCDREVISWCAGTGAISGEMIRDLMPQSVEQRFKWTATPHPVQW